MGKDQEVSKSNHNIEEVDELLEDNKIITFRIAKEVFGIEITNIREIVTIDKITPIYRVDNFFKGLVNLRGQIKPVIDLGIFLNIKDSGIDIETILQKNEDSIEAETLENMLSAVVVTNNDKELICLVNTIESVKSISFDNIQEVATTTEDHLKKYIKYIIKTGTKPISILNVEHIMNSEVWGKYQ